MLLGFEMISFVSALLNNPVHASLSSPSPLLFFGSGFLGAKPKDNKVFKRLLCHIATMVWPEGPRFCNSWRCGRVSLAALNSDFDFSGELKRKLEASLDPTLHWTRDPVHPPPGQPWRSPLPSEQSDEVWVSRVMSRF